ncbi:MAG: NUDIX domain-containing protein [Melioribacteraceae bacterium]
MRVVSYLIEAHIFRFVNNELEFLLLKRSSQEKYPNIWQMVTGSVDSNEKGFETALREIKEETGLTPVKFWVAPQVNSFYSAENDEICMVPVFAAMVQTDSEVKISSEHSEFKWLAKDEAKKLLAWKGQRMAVDTIHEYFTNEKSFLKFVEIDLQSI